MEIVERHNKLVVEINRLQQELRSIEDEVVKTVLAMEDKELVETLEHMQDSEATFRVFNQYEKILKEKG